MHTNDLDAYAEQEERAQRQWQDDLNRYRFKEHFEMPENQINKTDERGMVHLGDVTMKGSAVIPYATKLANDLGAVIRSRKLSIRIRQKEYVTVEGWSTCGAMMGCFPEIESVDEYEPHCFEAWATINAGSRRLTRASATCGTDEPMWAGRTDNQRRSMAQTRATAKAFRLAFAWIVTMGGFEASTAEEMQTGHENDPDPEPEPITE